MGGCWQYLAFCMTLYSSRGRSTGPCSSIPTGKATCSPKAEPSPGPQCPQDLRQQGANPMFLSNYRDKCLDCPVLGSKSKKWALTLFLRTESVLVTSPGPQTSWTVWLTQQNFKTLRLKHTLVAGVLFPQTHLSQCAPEFSIPIITLQRGFF